MNKYLYAFLCICASIAFVKTADAQAPTAKISLSRSTGCSPIVVSFTDSSTGSPTSWSWNLGNGVTSNIQNPSTTYFTAGTYNISLTVSNANGSSTDTTSITVYASPSISFLGDSLLSCPPKSVSFTNNTVTGGTSGTYLWDFGDGDTSSLVNPSHIYTTTGNYNVSLVVTNNLGCTKTLTKNNYVKVDSLPKANYFLSNRTSCTVPLTTSFTNASTNGASYLWDFGDGSTSTATAPSHTYTTAGSYTVKLITYSATGCSDTIVGVSIINIGNLNANFTKSATSICQGQSISFTNTTTPGTGTSIWHYGDGSIDTVKNGQHTYSTAGTYTVTLIELYSNCTDTTTQTVTVLQNPTAQFSTNDTIGCGTPFAVSFTNNSSNANSYAWTFGDATTSSVTSPSKSYTSLGKFNVSLIATSSNGCKDTITKNDFIKNIVPTGKVVSQAYYGCAPINIAFDVYVDTPLYANSYTWNYGDGTGTSSCSNCAATHHTFNSAGTYTVTATYNTSPTCIDTVTTNVTIGTVPTSNFTASPTTVCTFDTVSFSNSSTGADSYEWHYGDGSQSNSANPTYSYSNPGTYTVSLIAMDHGCRDTSTRTNYITVSGPIAKFAASYNCNNRLAYTFTDQSQYGQVYVWNFGDGNSSSQAGTVTHTYAAPGSYNVSLTVTDTVSMCSNTYDLTIGIYSLSAQFTADDTTICKGNTVQFEAQAATNISKYIWNFGEGTDVTKTSDTASKLYANGGIYNVRLIVSDTANCRDTLTKSTYIQVGGPTVALGATPTLSCAPANIAFTDSSIANGGFAITNRKWTFGDGTDTTITGTTISHPYPLTSSYKVTLALTDVNGCTANKAIVVEVKNPVPKFNVDDTLVCLGDTISFSNVSVGYTGALISVWDFGDGNTSSTFSPKHAYTAAGNYTVKLTITTNTGCTDSLIKTALVNVDKPTAKFVMSDSVGACPPLTVYMTDSSSGASNYNWTFGNNTSSTLSAPTAVYTYPGVYTVKQIVTSAQGCKDSASKAVTVYGPTGTFAYSPTGGCNPVMVSFSATSSNTATYIWDMNNGITQSTAGNSFSYTYTQAGRYLPKLILSDGGTCLVPIQGDDTITVDYVNGDFSFSSVGLCDSSTVQFTDTVFESFSTLTTRSWNFGDGSTSTAHNPSHKYTTSGNYIVTLVLTNSYGCKDTITKNLTIHTSPTVNITSAAGSICQGQATGLPLGVTGASTYTWTPSTGLSCTSCTSPTALPTSTTSYIVTGTDTNGCFNKDTVVITVNPQPSVSGGTDKTICVGGAVQLQGSGASNYTWSPSTGLSCTSCTSPNASPTTTSVYAVIGTDANGCKDTANVTVTVSTKPTVSAGGSKAICIGDSVALIATGASNYTWSPTSTLSCSSCDTSYAQPTSTTTYTVIGTSGNNCSDTTTVTVNVNSLPSVSAGNDVAMCIGSNMQLGATGATSYVWTPSTGLSCTNCNSPTTSTTTTTDYIVNGTDANGCKNSDTVKVTINPQPTVSAGSNKTICIGSATQLQATGATSYSWSPSTGLSCTNCANPSASPTVTTVYTVVGTNANGCKDTATVTVNVNAQPTVSAGSNTSICFGDSTTLKATGASTYIWSPASTLSCTACDSTNAFPTISTAYTVIGTDANGCKDTASVTVTINSLPNVNAGTDTAMCIGNAIQLTASGANSYSWTPTTGLSCTSCVSPTTTTTTTTDYIVSGMDTNGCVNKDTVKVTINPLPSVGAGSNVSICLNDSTQLTATGAVSYTWSSSTGLSCTGCISPFASPTGTTTYTVTGTNANGCVDTANVTVTIKPLPNVNAGTDKAICNNTAAQLQATGAASYTWSPSTGLSCTSCANPSATPSVTTSYIVTGTATNACKNTDTVIVSINALPTVSAGNNVSVCSGKSTVLTASGASTYTWSPSTGLSCTSCISPTASPTTTTTYTVTGTNANGCTNTAQVTVTINPLPTINAGNDVTVCIGQGANLSATGGTSYTWSPSAGLNCTNCQSPTATPTATTTYIVSGTNANGCTNVDSVKVTTMTIPNVTASNNTSVCIGDSTQLQASGSVNYSWSPSVGLSCTSCANPMAAPNTTTNYIVTGTSGNNCTDTAAVIVTVNPLPNITPGNDQSICLGDSVQLTVSGATTYTWASSVGLSCTSCTSPKASPPTTTTYTITGTDANGCVDTAQLNVTVKPIPTVSITPSSTLLCDGDAVQLLAAGATTYTWTPNTNLSCTNCANPSASPSSSITYMVTGTTNGCSDTATTIVTVIPKPNVQASADVDICEGDSTTLSVTGGVSNYTWSPVTTLSCINCTSTVAKPSATTEYLVTGIDQYNCKNTDTVKVTVHAPPAVSAGSNKEICNGESVQLTGAGAITYTWSPPTSLSCTNCQSPTANPTSDIIYKLIGVDQYGCSDSSSVAVTIIQKQPITFSSNDTICLNQSAQLLVDGGDSYEWWPAIGLNNTLIANPVASPKQTTQYRVIVGQNKCFSDTGYINIKVNPIPEVDLGKDHEIKGGESVQLVILGNNYQKFEWSPARGLSCTTCQSPTASPLSDVTYTVTVENEFGCTASDKVSVFVTCGANQLFLANTFTPNGDGLNDKFYPQGRGIADIQRFSIYNRWGELIFDRQGMSINDPLQGWDGTYKGAPLKPDVFIYIISATCETGKTVQLKGDISLVR